MERRNKNMCKFTLQFRGEFGEKILIVDDHHLVGEGTRAMLEEEGGFTVHCVSTAKEAMEIKTEFDVYIIDIHMPDLSGIELSKELLKENKDRKIILYTGLSNQIHLHLFTDIGISGAISKTATKSELITLIHTVLSDYTIVPLSLFRSATNEVKKSKGLTEREISILNFVSKGLSNKEIGEKIFLTDRSVEYHLTKMYKKLGVKTREEAVLEGVRLGLIEG